MPFFLHVPAGCLHSDFLNKAHNRAVGPDETRVTVQLTDVNLSYNAAFYQTRHEELFINTGVPVMKIRTLLATCITGGVLATTSASADHNSIWGEGWANMPNDIHNTRIETLNGDNSEFIVFIRGGGGADSVNDAVLDPDVEQPGNRAESQTSTGASDAANMSRSAARTSTRSSAGTMSRSGGR
jgi:hypothetical protein